MKKIADIVNLFLSINYFFCLYFKIMQGSSYQATLLIAFSINGS